MDELESSSWLAFLPSPIPGHGKPVKETFPNIHVHCKIYYADVSEHYMWADSEDTVQRPKSTLH